MEGFPEHISTSDMNTFPGAPDVAAKAKKPEPKREPTKLTKAQIEKAQQFSEEQKQKVTASDRMVLTRKINMYMDKLGHLIEYKPPKITSKTSIEQLEEILFNIQSDLAMRGGIENAAAAYMNLMLGVETISTQLPFGLKLAGPHAGLTAVLARNEAAWKDMVTEVAIEYSEWLQVSPMKRLLFFTAQTALVVHQANIVGDRMAQPVDENLREEATDL